MSKETFGRLVGASLVRQTVFAVAALLLGSSLFIGLISFALVSTVEGLLPSGAASAEQGSVGEEIDEGDVAGIRAKPPVARSLRPKRTGQVTDVAGEADR